MAACPTCQAEVPLGNRYCNICHTNVLNPAVGRLASPGKRLGAYVLDFILPIVAVMFNFGIGGLGYAAGGKRAGGSLSVLLVAVLLIAYTIYAIRLFAHATPGKKMLNMYVVKEDGERAGFLTMLFREWIGKWISGLVFLLGYLWMLIDKDRQAWHDKLASTYVVEQRD